MTLIAHPKHSTQAFQLKGGIYTLTTLELHATDEVAVKRQLTDMVSKAPHFFQQTPVVLALDKLSEPDQPLHLPRLRHLLHEAGMILVAIRGGSEIHKKDASISGIAWLPPQRTRTVENPGQQEQQKAPSKNIVMMSGHSTRLPVENSEAEKVAPLAAPKTTIISRPVRSGQQIYSPGDLVVLGAVSTGAELLAGGHIHVYGPLRGRALAGVNGNREARIFCNRFEAELVSICGQYKLPDRSSRNSWSELWGASAQIMVHDSGLRIDILS